MWKTSAWTDPAIHPIHYFIMSDFLNIILLTVWPSLNLPLPYPPDSPSAGTLSLRISGISPAKGILRIALFRSPDDFMQTDLADRHSILVSKYPEMTAVIPDLPFGTYALAVFQDENENGVLDKNLLGIPSEPYAFSGQPASKWRIPSFDQCRFTHPPPNQTIQIRLNKW
ncbi:MAG: hypothetical protein RLY31_2948 [Bacteroidota bacterium]|jgi:uncharacterized protein (DUF2141 family)